MDKNIALVFGIVIIGTLCFYVIKFICFAVAHLLGINVKNNISKQNDSQQSQSV